MSVSSEWAVAISNYWLVAPIPFQCFSRLVVRGPEPNRLPLVVVVVILSVGHTGHHLHLIDIPVLLLLMMMELLTILRCGKLGVVSFGGGVLIRLVISKCF